MGGVSTKGGCGLWEVSLLKMDVASGWCVLSLCQLFILSLPDSFCMHLPGVTSMHNKYTVYMYMYIFHVFGLIKGGIPRKN